MTSDTMSNMPNKSLLLPDNLNVKGRGLSPPPTTPSTPADTTMLSVPTSSRSSMSDEDEASEQNEELNVLNEVREMNQFLVRQIDTLRLKIKVDEKNYNDEKARLVETKDTEIRKKEREIDDMKESLVSRDDKIHQQMKASKEKDKTIQSKCEEIEDLKKVVKETMDYAQKLQKEVERISHQKDKLGSDPLYKQQNEEIQRLTEELEILRTRLATVEQELDIAMKVIEQQNEKMKIMNDDTAAMQMKFRKELERASKALRHEMERMREVMRQNYEGMKIIQQQNKEMLNEVRDIKEMFKTKLAEANYQNHLETYTGIQHPTTAGPRPRHACGKQNHGLTSAVAPKGLGKMVGGSISQSQTQFASRDDKSRFQSNPVRNSIASDTSGQQSGNTTSRLSPDVSARPLAAGHCAGDKFTFLQNPHVPVHNNENQNNLPPIPRWDVSFPGSQHCVSEGVPVPARPTLARGGRLGARRGKAVRK